MPSIKLEMEEKVNGDCLEVDDGGYGRICCCDCGLMHLIIFKWDSKRKKIQTVWYRDDAATLEARKKKHKK